MKLLILAVVFVTVSCAPPAPSEPSPVPSEPSPVPPKPISAPSKPIPAPPKPIPAPSKPVPAQPEPVPAPSEPIVARSKPNSAPSEQIPIVKFEAENGNPDGSYQFSYETGNNIIAQEQGVLKEVGNNKTAAEEVSGSYEYTADDGSKIQLSYIANENGFQPQGAHIPTPPPIPPVIQRALEYIAAHPEPEKKAN